MAIFLLVIGVANLAVLFCVLRTLRRIGKELNHFEQWKGCSVKDYF